MKMIVGISPNQAHVIKRLLEITFLLPITISAAKELIKVKVKSMFPQENFECQYETLIGNVRLFFYLNA